MSDGAGQFVTRDKLDEREDKLRAEMKQWRDEILAAIEKKQPNGHDLGQVITSAVEAGINNKLKALASSTDAPVKQIIEQQSIKSQVIEMASGKHGTPIMVVGIGMILIGVALLLQVPIVARLFGI